LLKKEESYVKISPTDIGKIEYPHVLEPPIKRFKMSELLINFSALADPMKSRIYAVDLSKEEYMNARMFAAFSLGKIGDPRAVEPLIETLKDENSDVKMFAAFSLGKIGDPRAVKPLTELLKDENLYVREETAEALGKIDGARTV